MFNSSNIVDPSKDLEHFRISTIHETSFESCAKLRRIKYPPQIKHNLFAFRKCPALEIIDINEECKTLTWATNPLIGSYNIKAIILRQREAFKVPEPLSLFYGLNYPRGFKIYIHDEILDEFKLINSDKSIINHFTPLSEYNP